jgi:uncharacterized small protein (DUF1192 family)
MTSLSITFFEVLQEAGVTAPRAKEAVETLEKAIDSHYAVHSRELATRGDMEKMWGELKAEIASTKAELLKWYIGIAAAQTLGIGYFILRALGKG